MAAIAILTGASSGIGAAAASRFLSNGDVVINISRRDCPVSGVETLATDFADDASVANTCEQLIQRLAAHQGTPVCLVHNAALMLKDRCDTTEMMISGKSWQSMWSASTRSIAPCYPECRSIPASSTSAPRSPKKQSRAPLVISSVNMPNLG